ncbi:hypothetical protein [Chryseobacterium sp. S90]|uniref:hypothetical protein n=1 Tax=Chryseobacterium sp. S90 TaxID=3395373 RepID=UPI0039BD27AD
MAKFNFLNLDSEVRNFMLDEINLDVERDVFFLSERLNEYGKSVYEDFLIKSVKEGDEEGFEALLEFPKFFNGTEIKNSKQSKVPKNASTLICQSEFNRYYIRGVCLKAIKDGVESVEIYRGRQSSFVRPESELQIGKKLDPRELLEDLRNSIGKQPKLFPEINSGLTIMI